MAYLLKTLQMGTPATGLVVGRGAVEGELFVVSCIEDSAIKSVLTQEDDIVTKSMHKAPIVSMSMSNSAAGRKDVLVTADSENVIVLWNPIVGSVIRAFTPTVASRINAALLFHGPVEHAGNNDNMPSYTPMFDTQSDTTQSDPESLLILGHDNGNITMWDLNTDKCVNCIEGHDGPIQSLSLGYVDEVVGIHAKTPKTVCHEVYRHPDSDSMRVRGKPGGGALLSDTGLDAPSQITNLTDEETGTAGGFFGAWGSQGTAATVPYSEEGGPIAVAEHDIQDLKLVRTPVFVSCSVDTTCRSWNLREGVQRRVFRHRSLCTAAALSHPIVSRNAAKMRPIRPLVATCGAAGSLRLWDELTGTLLHKFKGHAVSQFVFSVAFWIDKEVLLVSGGADHSIKVWDCVSGEGVATFLGHKDLVTSVSVVERYKGMGAAQGLGSREDAHHHPSAHAAIVSSSLDGTVRVWDLQKLVHMCFRSVLQCGCFNVDHSEGHRNAQMGYNPKHKFNRKPLPGNRSRPYAPFYPKVRAWNAHIHQAQAKVGFGMKPKDELNVLELEDRETWEEQQALKMYALEEDKWAETTVRETSEDELPMGVEWEELTKNKFYRDKLEEAKEAEDLEMKNHPEELPVLVIDPEDTLREDAEVVGMHSEDMDADTRAEREAVGREDTDADTRAEREGLAQWDEDVTAALAAQEESMLHKERDGMARWDVDVDAALEAEAAAQAVTELEAFGTTGDAIVLHADALEAEAESEPFEPSYYNTFTCLARGMDAYGHDDDYARDDMDDSVAMDLQSGAPLAPGVSDAYSRRMNRPTARELLLRSVEALSGNVIDMVLGKGSNAMHPLGYAANSKAAELARLPGARNDFGAVRADAFEDVKRRLNDSALVVEVPAGADKPIKHDKDLIAPTGDLTRSAVTFGTTHFILAQAQEKALQHEQYEVAKEGQGFLVNRKVATLTVDNIVSEMVRCAPTRKQRLMGKARSIASIVKERVDDAVLDVDNLHFQLDVLESITAALDYRQLKLAEEARLTPLPDDEFDHDLYEDEAASAAAAADVRNALHAVVQQVLMRTQGPVEACLDGLVSAVVARVQPSSIADTATATGQKGGGGRRLVMPTAPSTPGKAPTVAVLAAAADGADAEEWRTLVHDVTNGDGDGVDADNAEFESLLAGMPDDDDDQGDSAAGAGGASPSTKHPAVPEAFSGTEEWLGGDEGVESAFGSESGAEGTAVDDGSVTRAPELA